MRQTLLICAAWTAILLIALSLRVHDLGERPMHADEATGARILAQRLEGGAYTFDPTHFHGPLLSDTAAPIARSRGETSWQELTKTTLRLGPALAGTLLVLCPLLWRERFGHGGALCAGALLATSPLLVYYSRMFIHETLLALLAMLGCAAFYRLAKWPTATAGILAGVCAGLMFATKETFVITLFSWICAAGLILLPAFVAKTPDAKQPSLRAWLTPTALAVLAAGLVSAFFYSDGFRSPGGVIDAVRTFFVYETGAGHDKGNGYYLHLLLWPKHAPGVWWTEALVAALAILACLRACGNRDDRAVPLFLGASLIVQVFVYSLIGYKTPWLMLVPWSHACLLAGYALKPGKHTGTATLAAAVLLAVAMPYHAWQSIHAAGRLANDPRNPYAYVPTSHDAESLSRWLGELNATHPGGIPGPVAVVGAQYWPLPWYLRDFDKVGYWPEADAALAEHPVILSMPGQTPAMAEVLATTHTELPRTLRANVPVVLFLRNDIWEAWHDREPQ